MKLEYLELRQLYETCERLLQNDLLNARKRMEHFTKLVDEENNSIDDLKLQLKDNTAALTKLNKKIEE